MKLLPPAHVAGTIGRSSSALQLQATIDNAEHGRIAIAMVYDVQDSGLRVSLKVLEFLMVRRFDDGKGSGNGNVSRVLILRGEVERPVQRAVATVFGERDAQRRADNGKHCKKMHIEQVSWKVKAESLLATKREIQQGEVYRDGRRSMET